MAVTAPSTPTIPPPSPRWQERKAGQRFARVHARLRRPNVARPWVRVGTPDALPHVRRRRDARDQRLFRRVFVFTSLVLAASLTVHVVSSHEVAPLDGHRVAYAAAADLVRNGEVVGDPSVWKADVAGGTVGETRRALSALGVRKIMRDEAYDAVLFRPGGAYEEVALAHVPGAVSALGRTTPDRPPAFADRADPVEEWEPLGDNWYRIRGRW